MKQRLSIATFALIALMGLSACNEEAVPVEVIRPVKATQIGDARPMTERWLTGRARATREVDISFRVAGPLVSLPVKIGDEVKKGAILAKLDPAPFKADVTQSQAALKRAQASAKNSNLELDRNQKLYKDGFVSKSRLDSAIAESDVAQADVSSARAALERTKLDLSYTVIKAPFDGIVVATYVENYEDVQAKQAILRVVNASQIEMVVDVPEALISGAHHVLSAIVKFDAFPGREFEAAIKEVGTEASDATRTYPITLVMDQPADVKILPGMAGRARAGRISEELQVEQTGLDVPVSAAFTDGDTGKTYLWIVDESAGTVSRRQVEINAIGNMGLRITSGVKTGEWVVTAGVNSLRDGQTVRILGR